MSGPQPPTGLLLIDKPAGWTSHDVVRRVRWALKTRRVGHAGTLDPLATGLLPVLVGSSTRLLESLHGWDKTYVGFVLIGVETETGDLEGVAEDGVAPAPLPPSKVVAAARVRLTGRQLQLPPAYSAKKIGGVAAHRIARQGFTPALAPVPVTIHRLRLVPGPAGRLAFSARVSSGTYLRSFARDLGRLLGTGACLALLRRTAIGPLRVREAIRIDRADSDTLRSALRPPASIPVRGPTVVIQQDGVPAFRGGRSIPGPTPVLLAPSTIVRVLGPDGEMEGLGTVDDCGRLRPRVVLVSGGPGRAADPGRWSIAEVAERR